MLIDPKIWKYKCLDWLNKCVRSFWVKIRYNNVWYGPNETILPQYPWDILFWHILVEVIFIASGLVISAFTYYMYYEKNQFCKFSISGINSVLFHFITHARLIFCMSTRLSIPINFTCCSLWQSSYHKEKSWSILIIYCIW